MARRLRAQEKKGRNQRYCLHAPEVECIHKGKARRRYEFGVKASIATKNRSGFVLDRIALAGNPDDGHTLKRALDQVRCRSRPAADSPSVAVFWALDSESWRRHLRRFEAPRTPGKDGRWKIPASEPGSVPLLGRVNATRCIDDRREDDESEIHDIKLVEAREDSAKALESPEQALDLVAPPVPFPVVFPGGDATAFRRDPGREAEVGNPPAGFLVFIGPIHDQCRSVRRFLQPLPELPPLRGIVRVAGRAREGNGRWGIRGHQRKRGVPPAPGLSDARGAVFFRAPVPSGCPLMRVLSRPMASPRIRIIRARCRCANPRSRTPFFDHRFRRV